MAPSCFQVLPRTYRRRVPDSTPTSVLTKETVMMTILATHIAALIDHAMGLYGTGLSDVIVQYVFTRPRSTSRDRSGPGHTAAVTSADH